MFEPSLVPGDKCKNCVEVDSAENVGTTKESSDSIEQNFSNENAQGVNKKRRLTSKVWEDFDRVVLSDKKMIVVCKYCEVKLVVDSAKDISPINCHRKTCDQLKLKKRSKYEVDQMLLNTDTQIGDESEIGSNFEFDPQVTLQCLARMIFLHGYPYSIVEQVGFREFSNILNPQFQMVSKATIIETCMQLYKNEKAKLYETLDSVSSKISISCDLWTSGQTKGYISITAHYIDRDWQMQKRLLNFTYIPSPHTSLSIAEKIFDKLLEWNIESKLSSIILDNCTTNDVVARVLQKKVMSKGLLTLDGSFFHVRCCAHTLNLIVQDGLSEISHVIESVRNCAQYVKSSNGRKKRFEEVISQVQTPQKQLVLDEPTMWNSTYVMLSTALELRNAFTCMANRDKNFPMTFMDDDWENVESVCKCLNLFYDATLAFSSTSRPTVNDLYIHLINILMKLKVWVKSNISFLASMAGKMLSKFDQYWGTINKLLSVGSIIDPRYKMHLLSFCCPKIYGDESDLYIDEVKKALEDLYKEYCCRSETSSTVGLVTCESSGLEQSNDTSRPLLKNEFPGYREYLSSKIPAHVKSELELYLDEEVIHVSLHDSFNILEWWKFNQFKYPIVSRMARDILGIPVSTEVFEAAFSTGGGVIDQYRSKWKPKTIEARMCTQDWLRYEMKGKSDDIGFSALYSMVQDVSEEEDVVDGEDEKD